MPGQRPSSIFWSLFFIAHIPSDQSRGRMLLCLIEHCWAAVVPINCSDTPAPRSLCFKLLYRFAPSSISRPSCMLLPESPRLNSGRPISARPAHSIILPSADARPEHHAPSSSARRFRNPSVVPSALARPNHPFPQPRRGRTFTPA